MDSYENNPYRKPDDKDEHNPYPENQYNNDNEVDLFAKEMDKNKMLEHNPTHDESVYQTTEKSKDVPPRRKEKNAKTWLSGIVGGAIGGAVSAVLVVYLFFSGIIPLGNSSSPRADNSNAVETAATPIIENLTAEDADVSANIQEVAEAVVGIVNLQQYSIWTGSEEAGTGSGIIYKKENGKAYVVTNQHVIDGAKEIEVVLNDEERLPAKVLGEDSLTDLAVLEIDGEMIQTVANIGSSEDLVVGETVLAIGNPLSLEFANSVTKGIISGLNRSVPVDTNGDMQPDWMTEVIQTDAAINPGNSGGALVNAEGEVIGINSMKIAESAVEGIGFAIPVDTAFPIIEQLETKGEVVRPQIGITTAPIYQVPPQVRYEIHLPEDLEGGMVIASVEKGSPADKAGLQQFDVITKINGHEVTSILELRKYLYTETSVGDMIEIEYVRDGKRHTTELQLVEYQAE